MSPKIGSALRIANDERATGLEPMPEHLHVGHNALSAITRFNTSGHSLTSPMIVAMTLSNSCRSRYGIATIRDPFGSTIEHRFCPSPFVGSPA